MIAATIGEQPARGDMSARMVIVDRPQLLELARCDDINQLDGAKLVLDTGARMHVQIVDGGSLTVVRTRAQRFDKITIVAVEVTEEVARALSWRDRKLTTREWQREMMIDNFLRRGGS